MKSTFKIIIAVLLFSHLISCEKEIDIEVDNANIKPVVEANLSNKIGDASVSIFYSQNLNDTIPAVPITDAIVSIKDLSNSETYYLTQEQKGIYSNKKIKGQVGNSYKLEIELSNGSILEAEGCMPEVIKLESIQLSLADDVLQDEDVEDNYYEVIPIFNDKAGIENFYFLKIIKNNDFISDFNVFKDLGFDGKQNTQRIFTEAESNEELTFELQNIDENIYDYFHAVAINISQSTGTPTNPISNVKGEALGYFNVYSASKPITIKLEDVK